MNQRIPTLAALLALSLPAAAQKTGDTVSTDIFAKLEWIQGEAPKQWEPGKPYIIEAWATWCGPCIATIPHMEALHDNYGPRGLRVISVNVKEDGKEKVGMFVKKKGDAMSYPVAYSGAGGVFETDWMKPADGIGLPYACVVMDGKVLFHVHPARISPQMIEALLSGPESVEKVTTVMVAAEKLEKSIRGYMNAFEQAAKKGDLEAMKAAAEGLGKIPQAAGMMTQLELAILTKGGDWAGAMERLGELKSDKTYAVVLFSVANELVKPESKAPEDFRKFVATSYEEVLEVAKIHPLQFNLLARLQWINGDKEAAVASTGLQIEMLKLPGSENYASLVGPCEQFSAALKEGNMPTEKEFQAWLRKAQKDAAAARDAAPES